MIISQADPGFDRSRRHAGAAARPEDARRDRRAARTASRTSCSRCATRRSRSRKPVVYVHGDSHYFRIDKPLLDAQGRRLENFTRVETFGDNAANGTNDVHWVKVLVDPQSRDVFAFQPQIVPANRVAVPATL